eukprot:6187426-Pleurochrysis_carterae.AAC.4
MLIISAACASTCVWRVMASGCRQTGTGRCREGLTVFSCSRRSPEIPCEVHDFSVSDRSVALDHVSPRRPPPSQPGVQVELWGREEGFELSWYAAEVLKVAGVPIAPIRAADASLTLALAR